ncbi:MAG: site-specific DNA-methyltransferase [Acidobacteriaceae bacterium]
MNAAAQIANLHPERTIPAFDELDLMEYVPLDLRKVALDQTEIPELARNRSVVRQIEDVLRTIPTSHYLIHGDARRMSSLRTESVQLVLTSPPYWSLKRYDDADGQLGHIENYEDFLEQIERVWRRCYDSLIPGGRLICVVGDVCLSRRKNGGRHTVVPLHSSIQGICRKIGFDNLAPIIWHKIANAAYEVSGGGGFLGKPYEPNSVIKNDVEFILMLRKPGGYRKPDVARRILSLIGADNYQEWFQQIGSGLTGASTREHPAPYPEELAKRLIRMFSFVGDVVLDPFSGSGTTAVAAAGTGRNSIGYEISGDYYSKASGRFESETSDLFHKPHLSRLVEP